MLSEVKLRIMVRAIKIRFDNGEKLDDIMVSYSKLTEEDVTEIFARLRTQYPKMFE